MQMIAAGLLALRSCNTHKMHSRIISRNGARSRVSTDSSLKHAVACDAAGLWKACMKEVPGVIGETVTI